MESTNGQVHAQLTELLRTFGHGELLRRLIGVIKRHEDFDLGHRPDHVLDVATNAVILAEKHAPELTKLAIVAAIYHDVGMYGGRDRHEERSADAVRKDKVLARYFSAKEIDMIAEAVQSHRAEASRVSAEEPSILSKILADADRRPRDAGTALARAYSYRQRTLGNMSHAERLLVSAEYVLDKYGPDGYAKMHFPETRRHAEEVLEPLFIALRKCDINALHNMLPADLTITRRERRRVLWAGIGGLATMLVWIGMVFSGAVILLRWALEADKPAAATLFTLLSAACAAGAVAEVPVMYKECLRLAYRVLSIKLHKIVVPDGDPAEGAKKVSVSTITQR